MGFLFIFSNYILKKIRVHYGNMGCQVSEGGIQNQPYFWQKSPKEFSTFKCNVGNWIFSKSLDFLGITKRYSNMDGINLFVKILVFVKILGKWRRRKEEEEI